MNKLIGVILIIAGLAFVTWKFTFWNISGFPSLLLNIAGFFVMSIGYGLMKWKPKEKADPKKPQTKEKPVEVINEPEEYKTSDYSKYMPK